MKEMEQKVKEFDEKVKELQDLTFELVDNLEQRESKVVDFGYKWQEGNEIHTVTDFGNIRKFIVQSFATIYKQGLEDAIKICDKEINQFREPEMSAYKNGKVAEAQFIKQQFQKKLEEIK